MLVFFIALLCLAVVFVGGAHVGGAAMQGLLAERLMAGAQQQLKAGRCTCLACCADRAIDSEEGDRTHAVGESELAGLECLHEEEKSDPEKEIPAC